MTTETPTTNRELEGYIERMLPEALREDAGPPPSWPQLDRREWEDIAGRARAYYRLKATAEFAYKVAVEGRYGWEIASGTLAPGATENLATGEVIRPSAPKIPEALEHEAVAALQALSRAGLRLDPVLQANLEHAAGRTWSGESGPVHAAVDAANALVRGRELAHAAQVAEAEANPTLVVRISFPGPGGRVFAPGTYKIDNELAGTLIAWRDRTEGGFGGDPNSRPIQFREVWPPFELSTPSPPDAGR
jgi:hypothetical protein